jgi:hypothetical protein
MDLRKLVPVGSPIFKNVLIDLFPASISGLSGAAIMATMLFLLLAVLEPNWLLEMYILSNRDFYLEGPREFPIFEAICSLNMWCSPWS